MVSLVVSLDDRTEVTLCADGSATVDLSGMRVARHNLLGRISLYPDGSLTVWRCVDAMWGKPLPPHVARAAENAARRQAAKARRAARGILRQHTIIAALAQAGYGIVPVTGEGAVGYALAVRYEDGEFRLDPQGTLFSDLPTAASTCEAVQGGAERRGWGERWFVVKLTEVTDGRP